MEKEKIQQAMLVYAVTDRSWLYGQSLEEKIEKICKGGVTCIQLREKNMRQTELLKEAQMIKKITERYHIPFIINDSVQIAKEVGADGVHVGKDDMDIIRAREILGPNKIIGASARTPEEATAAWIDGADYIGCGAVFGTTTKWNAKTISLERLREVCQAVEIPVVAIGGIKESNLELLRDTGVAGAAFVSAIFANEDVEAAAIRLRGLAEDVFTVQSRR